MKIRNLIIVPAIWTLSSCDKPTSGQNTHEYRDGNSGATPATMEKDTRLDSAEKRRENEK